MKQPLEHIIQTFADKLPEFEEVRTEIVYFTGRELKLTGVKHYHGEPLQDDYAYGIDVPVLKPLDHKKDMRVAWLKGGLQGLYRYLEPYIGLEQLQRVQNYFMHA